MIHKVTAKNFTVFRDAEFSFSKGINVVIGSNGTGKSHILKLAYTAARWSQEMALREKHRTRPDKATLQKELGLKLRGVYRCEALGRLSTRGIGVRRTEVNVSFYQKSKANMEFSFSTKSSIDAVLEKVPAEFFADEAVFFPTKEMLTMFPGFAALYRNYDLQIDETYYDLCLALQKPLPRGPKLAEIRPLLEAVESVLDGSIQEYKGRFYLIKKGGEIEVPLLAEGFRKLGTVAYLLANGTLGQQSILFWDEPETKSESGVHGQAGGIAGGDCEERHPARPGNAQLVSHAGAVLATRTATEREDGAAVFQPGASSGQGSVPCRGRRLGGKRGAHRRPRRRTGTKRTLLASNGRDRNMSQPFIEGGLTFSFPDAWSVCRPEDTSFYSRHFSNFCGGCKEMDFLAHDPGSKILWLIEAKNYRQHGRTKPMDLIDEVAEKTRDVLAMLPLTVLRDEAGSGSTQVQVGEFWRRASAATQLRVVLHCELPASPSKLFPGVKDAANLLTKLRQKLRVVDPRSRFTDKKPQPGVAMVGRLSLSLPPSRHPV